VGMTDLCYYSKHFCKACCFYCAQEPLFLVLLSAVSKLPIFYLPTGDTTKSPEDQEREDREEEEEEEDEQ
jgi:hypothetical protein